MAKREKLDVVLNAQAVMYTGLMLDMYRGGGQTTEQHEIMLTLGELAEVLGAELVGEATSSRWSGNNPVRHVHTAGFSGEPSLSQFLEQTGAAAVLITEVSESEYCPVAALIVKDPYLAFRQSQCVF